MTEVVRTARHLGAAALIAAWLAAGPLCRDAEAAIYINEFMASNDSATSDELGVFSDWLELFNSSVGTVSIGGWYLSDNFERQTKYRIPDGTQIGGLGHLLIWADGTTVSNPLHTSLHASFKLRGPEGERIGLYAADGATTIDAIEFGSQPPDTSYGRRWDGWGYWGPFGTAAHPPTPGGPNSGWDPPGLLAGRVFINEWMAINTAGIQDDAGQFADWIEIYNASDVPVDLSGYYLTDNLLVPNQSPIPFGPVVWGSVIAPHGYVIYYADDDEDEGPLHAGFNLRGDPGEDIGLFEMDGATPIDTVSFGLQTANVSEGRRPDGGVERVFYSHPTPWATNYIPSTQARAWPLYR